MAHIDCIVRHMIRWEAGVINASLGLRALYDLARNTAYSNHALDRGGATMCGVTLTTFKEYRRSKGLTAPSIEMLKRLDYDTWHDILKTLYWDRWKADRIANESVAIMLVDWCWASGVIGIKRPQRLLGVTADGIVGPKTLAAVNNADQATLFERLMADREKHFSEIVARDASQKRWLKGWLNRIHSIKFKG